MVKSHTQVMSFLNQIIITRFGIPASLVFDNTTYFSSLKLTKFALEKGIKVKYETNYCPQGNSLAKSPNKNLIKILKKTITNHQRNWNNALHDALWAGRVTLKATIGNSPFFLFYGKEVILPPNIFLHSLQLAQSIQDTQSTTMQHGIDILLKLKEELEKSNWKFTNHQDLVKRWFDRQIVGNKDFQIGDLVLKWEKSHEAKGKHTNFQILWLGPFQIHQQLNLGTFILKNLEG